jgi:phosphohistidine phosphatase
LKLYLMRHGPAEDHADSGMDSDRALTVPGRDRVRGVAKLLLEADEQPLQVVTSPLVRAVQTAEIIALVTKLGDREGNVQVRRELSPGGEGGAALVANLASAGSKRVMLVGHEPDLSELAASLLPRAVKGGLQPFEKAMVVGFYVGPTGDHPRLRFVLDPRALKLDPDHRGSGL